MKKLTFFILFIFANIVFAEQRLHISVEADEYGEHIENYNLIGDEWAKTDDSFILNVTIPVSSLPYKTCLISTCLIVKKSGYVSFGGYIGNHDAGTESFFFIPKMSNGSFFNAQEAYHFNVESGDYASDLWSITADIKIIILD